MRLSTLMPAITNDADLDAERMRLLAEAEAAGTPAKWSAFLTLASGDYEVVVSDEPAPWE